MNALDLDSLPTPAMIPGMKAAGITAILLYSRLVTLEIAQLLSANDIDLVLIGEWGTGADPAHYTTANGVADAQLFLKEIAPLGVKPPGVYMCNGDFDANAAQIAGPCTEYRQGVKSVLDPVGIGAGGYGNGANMQAGLDDGTIEKAFVWAGQGTNGTVAFDATNRWSIRQYPTTTEFGASVDPDEVQGDYWGFRVPVAAPATSPAPITRTLQLDDGGADVAALQTALGITVDGVFGEQTKAAVEAFQTAHGLEVDGIVGALTAAALFPPAAS